MPPTVLAPLIALLVRALAWSWRVDRAPWPVEGPCVVAFLHGHLLPMVALHRGRGLVGLASRSHDGALVAAVLGALRYPVIRGSTSSGGVEALRTAERAIASGGSPAFAVDGPRGPAGVVQPGAEMLSRRTGVPVVYGVVVARGARLPTWDHFLVPWPFARVHIRYGVRRPGGESLEGGPSLEEQIRTLNGDELHGDPS